MGFKKKGSKPRTDDEIILRPKQFDSATCRELKGTLDEDGKCILRARPDPNDPDALILKHVNYRRPESDRRREE